MFNWIDEDNSVQVFWVKEYIAKKSGAHFSQLKDTKSWESIIIRDCDLTNQGVDSYLKAMKASWRKKLSRAKKKRDFGEGSTRERSFTLTNDMYFKLQEIAKCEGVTPSHILEGYIRQAKPPVYE